MHKICACGQPCPRYRDECVECAPYATEAKPQDRLGLSFLHEREHPVTVEIEYLCVMCGREWGGPGRCRVCGGSVRASALA